MKIITQSPNTKNLRQRLQQLYRYKFYAFIALVVIVYGYTILNINQAITVPASTDTQAAVKRSPKIDPELVQQLEQLQDNSVTVQTLFNDGRDNPFQ